MAPAGIADLTINRAGSPPGSGLDSLIIQASDTKDNEVQKTTMVNGTKKMTVPIKLTKALFFLEN